MSEYSYESDCSYSYESDNESIDYDNNVIDLEEEKYELNKENNITLINNINIIPKCICCLNSKLVESKILNYLKTNVNYNLYKDAGNEYFQCDLENLKTDIQNIISNNN